MNDQKNTLLAIVLSALVLIGWQVFFGMPQMEKQKQAQQQQQTQPAPGAPQPPGTTQPQTTAPPVPGTTPQGPGQPGTVLGQSREAALAASPRVRIETPSGGGFGEDL